MKYEAEDILEEIADDLIIYLKAGNININSFISKLNFNINNIEQLLRIHFLLSEEVIEFIKELPENLRRIKTSTRNVVEVLNGKIKGRIDWKDTFRERYKTNYLDRTRYSCIQRDKNFNIKENLVLKELLRIIIMIVKNDIPLRKNYRWMGEWDARNKLFQRLENTYSRNVYLNKIDTSGIAITDRMINDTIKSRNRFYRTAAALLALYRKLTNRSYWDNELVREEIKKLLQETFIRPESEDVLFELYWVFKILEKFQNVQYNLVDGRDNMAASWEDDSYTYRLYHDSEGSKDIQFRVDLSEVRNSDNEYLKRTYSSRVNFINMSREIFNSEKSSSFWSGRPDIILEKRDKETGQLEEIHIGEVKNTTKPDYAMEGLKELLEYMALIKDNTGYMNNTEMSDTRIKGFLCLNDVEVGVEGVGNVKVRCVGK